MNSSTCVNLAKKLGSEGHFARVAVFNRYRDRERGSLAIDVEQLYERYGTMVYRRCLHLLRQPAQAEDAMHDVFVQLLDHQDRLHDQAASSLLYRIATNVSLNRLRSIRRRPEDADDDLVLRIAHSDDLERRSAAANALSRLFGSEPVSTRTIATLHLADGWTLEEVAKEVGMSVSGVRKRLRGLRERLHALQPGEVA